MEIQNGGTGEYQRVMWLEKILDDHGITYTTFEIPDDAVAEGKRISIMVKFPGTADKGKTLWFMAHLDTVAPGDLSNWDTDPFKPTLKDGKIYGLGVEDNGQAVICLLEACMMMREMKLQTKSNVGFVFASDEETGSQYGLHAMVAQGLFSERDESVIPDAGSFDVPCGSREKSKFGGIYSPGNKRTVLPQLGINPAYRSQAWP